MTATRSIRFSLLPLAATLAAGLCHGAEAAGTVRAEDGRPVGSALIVYSFAGVYPPGTSYKNIRQVRPLPGLEPFVRSVRTDQKGGYVLPNLPAGRIDICASTASPYVNTCVWGGSIAVDARAGSTVQAPPIVLARGAVVRFQVDTADYQVAQKPDPAAPQFHLGMQSARGAFGAASLVGASPGQLRFELVIPKGTAGRYILGSRVFRLEATALPPGLVQLREDDRFTHVPVSSPVNADEVNIRLGIAGRRVGTN